jgi:ribosome-binding factor A
MVTKYTPDLRFRADESYDAGARIDAILRRPSIARDLEPEVRLPQLTDDDDDSAQD